MPLAPEPESLAVVRRFVNTLDVEDGVDSLDGPAALSGWLREAGLLRARARVTKRDVARAGEVREALRVLLLANNGVDGDVAAARAVLDAASERARLELRFEGGAALQPRAHGVDGALGAIVGAAGEAILAGTWPRLKACRAGDCTWAFWDAARNHSRIWCSMAVCGNRTKARAFRRRRAVQTAE
jgi:predicted RNA-binding Zn ribbon-like protein